MKLEWIDKSVDEQTIHIGCGIADHGLTFTAIIIEKEGRFFLCDNRTPGFRISKYLHSARQWAQKEFDSFLNTSPKYDPIVGA